MATIAQGSPSREFALSAGLPLTLGPVMHGLVLVVASLALVRGDWGPHGQVMWLQMAALAVYGAVVVQQWWWRAGTGKEAPSLAFRMGLSGLLALHVALAWSGALAEVLHPLVYALVAYLVTVNGRRVGFALVVSAVALEVLPWFAGALGSGAEVSARVLLRLALVVAFATLYLLFHRRVVMGLQRQHAQRLRAEGRLVKQRARELRIEASGQEGVAATESGAVVRQELRAGLLAGAVDACARSTQQSLALLRHGLGAEHVALFWVDQGEEVLVLREYSAGRALQSEPIKIGSGVVGGVARHNEVIRLHGCRPGFPGLSYQREGVRVGAFLGVPLREGDEVRAVLCVDRVEARPFSATVEQITRTLQSERLTLKMEQAKYDLSQFYEASRVLATALQLSEVLKLSLETVKSMVSYDYGAITLYDAEQDQHRIAAVAGARLNGLEGVSFESNHGLVSMAIKMRHFLPCGEWNSDVGYIFSSQHKVKGVRQLLVLPLVAQGRALGSFVVGGELVRSRREMLEVVANQVAVAIANAQMYDNMERLATTDGLTQLLNRRTFHERAREALARCERSKQPAALIMTDIDFFKKVNDTYGHPVGDEVLRGVAKIFGETLRCTDIIGRYGGEEMVVLLEDTSVEGAMLLAERLRKKVAAKAFETEKGTLRVTLSLGVASFPTQGAELGALVSAADQALYRCKAEGRDCVRRAV